MSLYDRLENDRLKKQRHGEEASAVQATKSDLECLQSMERSLKSLRRIGLYFLWLSLAGLILGLISFGITRIGL